MEPWMQTGLTIVGTVAASGGFWSWLQRRDNTKSAMSRLLLGLAYDKIQTLGMSYIDRGWISVAEYEDFRKYLFEPYKAFGGNGVAEQVMLQVSALPMRSTREIAYATIVEAKVDTKKGHPDVS